MKLLNPTLLFPKLLEFLKEVKVEGLRVNWPTREKTIKDTSIVIGFAVVVAAFLSSFDYLLQHVLKFIIPLF